MVSAAVCGVVVLAAELSSEDVQAVKLKIVNNNSTYPLSLKDHVFL